MYNTKTLKKLKYIFNFLKHINRYAVFYIKKKHNTNPNQTDNQEKQESLLNLKKKWLELN